MEKRKRCERYQLEHPRISIKTRSTINMNESQSDVSGIQSNSIQSDNFNLLPFTLSDDFNESISKSPSPARTGSKPFLNNFSK